MSELTSSNGFLNTCSDIKALRVQHGHSNQIEFLQRRGADLVRDLVEHRLEAYHLYLTERVCEVALQKSIPAQVRQLILHYYSNKNEFVRELTFAKRFYKHVL